MLTKIALAVGLFFTLTLVQSRGLDKAEKTSLTHLQGATEASAIGVFQSPPPDCDPVNDPSSCRY